MLFLVLNVFPIQCDNTQCTASGTQTIAPNLQFGTSNLCQFLFPVMKVTGQPAQNTSIYTIDFQSNSYCNCKYQAVLGEITCQFSFDGSGTNFIYFFDTANVIFRYENAPDQTFDIEFSAPITTPQLQLFCSQSIGSGYSGTFTNNGGCKPYLSTETATELTFSSCFGAMLSFVITGSNIAKPLFQINTQLIVNDQLTAIIVPGKFDNVVVKTYSLTNQSTGLSIVYNDTLTSQSSLQLSKKSLGVYQFQATFQDKCGSSYIYSEPLVIQNLRFVQFVVSSPIICNISTQICQLDMVFTNMSKNFSSIINICNDLIFKNNIDSFGSSTCVYSKTTERLVISFKGSYLISTNSVVNIDLSDITRKNLTTYLYIFQSQFTITNIPTNIAMSVNPFCFIDEVPITSVNIDNTITISNPYSCDYQPTVGGVFINNPNIEATPGAVGQYKASYEHCFRQNFTQIFNTESQKVTFSFNEPLLYDNYQFVLIADMSQFLIVNLDISLYKLVNTGFIIQATNLSYNQSTKQLNLTFQTITSSPEGEYSLLFPSNSLCNNTEVIYSRIVANFLVPIIIYGTDVGFTHLDAKQNFDLKIVPTLQFKAPSCTTAALASTPCTFITPQLPNTIGGSQCTCALTQFEINLIAPQFFINSVSSNLSKLVQLDKTQFTLAGVDLVKPIYVIFLDSWSTVVDLDIKGVKVCPSGVYVPNSMLHFYEVTEVSISATVKNVSFTSRFNKYFQPQSYNLQIPTLSFTLQNQDQMTCNETLCTNVDLVVTIVVINALVKQVSLSKQNVLTPLTQTSPNTFTINVNNPELQNGSYFIQIDYEDLCKNQLQQLSTQQINIYKSAQFFFYKSTFSTYSYQKYKLSPSDFMIKLQNPVPILEGLFDFTIQITMDCNLLAQFFPINQTFYATFDNPATCINLPLSVVLTFTASNNINVVAQTIVTVLLNENQMINQAQNCKLSFSSVSNQDSNFASLLGVCPGFSPMKISVNNTAASIVQAKGQAKILVCNDLEQCDSSVIVLGNKNILQMPTQQEYDRLPTVMKRNIIDSTSPSLLLANLVFNQYVQCVQFQLTNCLYNFPLCSSSISLFQSLNSSTQNLIKSRFLVDIESNLNMIQTPTGFISTSFYSQLGNILKFVNTQSCLNLIQGLFTKQQKLFNQNQLPLGLILNQKYNLGGNSLEVISNPSNMCQDQMLRDIDVNGNIIQVNIKHTINGLSSCINQGQFLIQKNNSILFSEGDVLITSNNKLITSSFGCQIVQQLKTINCSNIASAGSLSCQCNQVQGDMVQIVDFGGLNTSSKLLIPIWAIILIVILILVIIAIIVIVILCITGTIVMPRGKDPVGKVLQTSKQWRV